MGWTKGAELLNDVAEEVMPHIPTAKRQEVAAVLISLFEDQDCDNIDECDQADIAKEYDRQYPNDDDPWEDEEDDENDEDDE